MFVLRKLKVSKPDILKQIKYLLLFRHV